MLYNINTNLKLKKKLCVGDSLNLIYRFNGVFFILNGICSFNRKNSLGLILKRKGFFVFFFFLKKNIIFFKQLDTFNINNKKIKIFYKKIGNK